MFTFGAECVWIVEEVVDIAGLQLNDGVVQGGISAGVGIHRVSAPYGYSINWGGLYVVKTCSSRAHCEGHR